MQIALQGFGLKLGGLLMDEILSRFPRKIVLNKVSCDNQLVSNPSIAITDISEREFQWAKRIVKFVHRKVLERTPCYARPEKSSQRFSVESGMKLCAVPKKW